MKYRVSHVQLNHNTVSKNATPSWLELCHIISTGKSDINDNNDSCLVQSLDSLRKEY